MEERHQNGTPEQKRAASSLLNEPQARDGGANVDEAGNEGNCESIVDAGPLEELGSEVEDKVDTGELLKALKSTAGENTANILAAKAIGPSCLAQALLKLVGALNLIKLSNESRVVNGNFAKAREGLGSSVVVVL